MIGICTKYTARESAFVAIRLATAIQETGTQVSLFSVEHQVRRLDPYWDAHVVGVATTTLTKWAVGLTAVIFTFPPPALVVQWLNSQRIHSYVFVLCHDCQKRDRYALESVTGLLSPNRSCSGFIQNKGLTAIETGWDSGVPLMLPADTQQTAGRVLVPLWDGNIRKTEKTLLNMLEQLLEICSEVTVSIGVSASSIHGNAKREMTRLLRRFPKRCVMLTSTTPVSRELLYQQHSVTIVPYHFDNVGLVAHQALSLGSRVAAFAIAPFTDLQEFRDIRLAACRRSRNLDGCEIAVSPDYDELLSIVLQQLQAEPRTTSDFRLAMNRVVFMNAVGKFCQEIDCRRG